MPLEVAIVPAGQWGAALAIPLAARGHRVRLWLRRPGAVAEFETARSVSALPQILMPYLVRAVDTPAAALQGADLVILAPASRAMAAVCRLAAPYLPPAATVLSVTKGLDAQTYQRMSEIISEHLPNAAGRLAVLSGPNFATEVAQGLPAGAVVAATDLRVAEYVQEALMTHRLRIYTHDDVLGVELGGALKNVIALGVGISDGLGMGQNARATLITRGLAEIVRLGTAMGASPATFSGLSGLGDLVLTCTGDLSRNRQTGMAIGRGRPAAGAAALGTVEGVPTTRAANALALRYEVELPIAAQIAAVLAGNTTPAAAVAALMGRDKTQE